MKLKQHKEIAIDRETKEKLLSISLATIDTLLAKERQIKYKTWCAF